MVKESSMYEDEASLFESSEMLATFLTSTPLLEEAWKLCNHANTRNSCGFTFNQIGDVTYLAFSGVQEIFGMNPSFMVPLETSSSGVFSGFHGRGGDEGVKEPVEVHQGFLNLFLSFYNCPKFQEEMVEITNRSKSIVLTGHSVGGAIASLAALWLLCYLQTVSSPLQVLCITFGSPMLGNKSFSEAVLEERWGGNFCHLIAQDDIVPSLFFAPNVAFKTEIHCLAQYWNLSICHPYFPQLAPQLSDEKVSELFHAVLASLEALSTGANTHDGKQFWPFGSYMFCTISGSICLDNSVAIMNLLYVMLAKGSPRSSINSHLKYGEYVGRAPIQLLRRKDSDEVLPELNYDTGVRLALESSGISSQECISELARASLELAKQQGRRRNINSAKLTVELYNTKKLRVQIEWYKGFCDASDDQMGYYDSFKRRGPSKRDTKVNLNRLKLARFWDNVLDMLGKNQLPHDFHKLLRWVNAAQFYKLLVEPLEIAEYYRNGMHNKKGHYVQYGREKRYRVFDKWWGERNIDDDEKTIVRTDFASLTQDSCFWAKVEEARDSIIRFGREKDPCTQSVLLDKVIKFEQYARDIIEKKEISKDVLAKNSSFSLFQKEWKELSFDLHRKQTQLSFSFCSNLS